MDWHRMLAVQIADDILASVKGHVAWRIALKQKTGKREDDLGGLCRDALINCIEQSLKGGE